MRREIVNGEPTISKITLKLDGTAVELTKGLIIVNSQQWAKLLNKQQLISYYKLDETLICLHTILSYSNGSEHSYVIIIACPAQLRY